MIPFADASPTRADPCVCPYNMNASLPVTHHFHNRLNSAGIVINMIFRSSQRE
jgi:hypothetical protein